MSRLCFLLSGLLLVPAPSAPTTPCHLAVSHLALHQSHAPWSMLPQDRVVVKHLEPELLLLSPNLGFASEHV